MKGRNRGDVKTQKQYFDFAGKVAKIKLEYVTDTESPYGVAGAECADKLQALGYGQGGAARVVDLWTAERLAFKEHQKREKLRLKMRNTLA